MGKHLYTFGHLPLRMQSNQLVFDTERELVFAERYDTGGEYTYLAECYDLYELKNEIWKGVWGVVDEHEDAFGGLDLSILNIWFTPASGKNAKGAGFMYYQRIPEMAHMAFSLRMLDRIYTVGADREEFLHEFIKHELCHLVMYTEVGDHEENCEDFHKLLESVQAPTFVNFTEARHKYNYRC